MDNLPELVLDEIFSYLSLKDKIKLSLICSSWRNKIIFKNLNQDLIFCHFNNQPFPFNLKCSYSTNLIKYENSIQIKNFKFLQSSFTRIYFRNLKKLYIFNNEQFEIDIQNLGVCVNYFNRLELLSLTKLRLKEKTTINLANLKVLILKYVTITNQLDLNTCNLQEMICWCDITRICFRFPKKLIRLELKNSNLEFSQEFKNLESLSYFVENGLIRNDLLSNLTRLRNLTVFSPFVEHDLKELERQKRKFKLNALQIYSFGFKDKFIYFPINYHYIYLLDRFKLKELSQNYSQLNSAAIPFPVQIDFCSLIEFFETIPNDFFSKFSQIYQLNVAWNTNSLILNYLPLIKFIENCGYLRKLILNNCSFNQDFYDMLAVRSTIGQLEIKEFNELNIDNYHFLSRLVVFHLKIHLNSLPIRLLTNALENRNLKYFEFYKKNLKVLIKNNQAIFYLEFGQFIHEFDSLKLLIAFLQGEDKINHLFN